MTYFKEIIVTRTISADPIYCSMIDGKQTHHCSHELRGACALFGKALKQDSFVNMKCKECLEAPTVGAIEVVHGKWNKEKCQGDYGRCSECECRIPWIPQNYQYCPKCGAKMSTN